MEARLSMMLCFLGNPVLAVSVLAFSLTLAVLSVALLRRGDLTMRYALGWIFVATCVFLGGVFGELVEPIASALSLSPREFAMTAAGCALLAIGVQLSITVSGLIGQDRELAESIALLHARIELIESIEERGDGPSEC
jgi:hypothetical protein